MLEERKKRNTPVFKTMLNGDVGQWHEKRRVAPEAGERVRERPKRPHLLRILFLFLCLLR